MANVENTTIWRQIQQGVKETERLIGRREYNLAMVKSRQTLECMVRCMAEKACLVEGDLSDTIDQLYEGRWISRNTRDHYHNIRILGNKAVHEGDDTAYDANQAFQLLVHEIREFPGVYAGGGGHTSASRPSARRPSQGRIPARSSGQTRRPQAPGQRHPSGNRRKKRRNISPAYYMLRFLVPLLAVILLIVVIKAMMPGKEVKKETTAPSTVEVTTEAPSQPEPPTTTAETMPETEPTEPAGSVYVISGNSVNVRKEPSKDGKILVQLKKGTTVDYVKRYSNDWAVINYDGQEAYVSSQFLKRQEPETESQTQAQAQTAAP